MVGFPKTFESHKDYLHIIKMIDFGLAQKYLDAQGNHIPAVREKYFQGNLIFASKHCFNLVTHSRRDDLISLSYLLLYLIDGDLAFLAADDDQNGASEANNGFNHAEFKRIRKLKNKLTPAMLCESKEAKTLLPFMEEIFSYEFDQTPNYFKLASILLQCLTKEGK